MTTMPQDLQFEPVAPPTARWRFTRSLAAAGFVFVGGYLVIQSLTGLLVSAVAGIGYSSAPHSVLLVGQLVFAVLVVAAGLLTAPGSPVAALGGTAIVAVGAAVFVAVGAQRLNGGLRLPPESLYTISNPWLVSVLVVGIAWLLVRRARLGWISLIGVAVLSPIPQWLAFVNVDFEITHLVMLALSAVVGGVILAAGRPWHD